MFALCRSQRHRSIPREHPDILVGLGVGMKKRPSAYKSYISETRQDRTKSKITIEAKQEVPYAISIMLKSTILDYLERTYVYYALCLYSVSKHAPFLHYSLLAMSTASGIKGKELPAHSASIEIYSCIARFPCDRATLV